MKQTATTQPLVLKTQMEIPLSSSYLGVFFGSRGKHIKPLCSKHGVAFHFGDQDSQKSNQRSSYKGKQYIHGTSVKVSIDYLPERGTDIEAVKTMLQKRAELVTKQRTQHENNVRPLTFTSSLSPYYKPCYNTLYGY